MTESSGFEGLSGQEILDKIEKEGVEDQLYVPGDDFHFCFEGSDAFKIAKAAFQSENNDVKVKEMDYEIALFDFIIDSPMGGSNNRFNPMCVSPDGSKCYPDITGISIETIDYYKNRAEQTKNHILRKRYSDFIWEVDKDHKYARLAIESYLISVNNYFSQKSFYQVADSLARGLQIALALNDTNLIATCVRRHLEYLDKYKSDNNFSELDSILHSLFQCNKLNGYVSFDEINLYFDLAIEGIKYDVVGKNTLIDIRAKFNKIFGNRDAIGDLEREKAESYVAEADRRKNSAFIQSIYLDKAIKQYYKINKRFGVDYTDKIDALKKRIKETNRKIPNEAQTIHVEAKIPNSLIVELLDEFKEIDLNSCLKKIGLSNDIVTPYDYALSCERENMKITPLQFMINTSKLSHDNIISETSSVEENIEKSAKEFIRWSGISMVSNYYNIVFNMLTQHKGLNANSLANYIYDSALVQDNRKPVLEKALERHFAEDYVSSVHILVFQIEGILRDILEKLNRPTTTIKHDATMESSLDAILRDCAMREFLTEDFALFLQIMLSDPEYLNLRNEIAHGLYKYESYTKSISELLIVILLRLKICYRDKFVSEK